MKQFGLEAGLGLTVAWHEELNPNVPATWLKWFGDIEGRAVTLGALAARGISDAPETALVMGADLPG